MKDKKIGKIYQTSTNEATIDDIKQTKAWRKPGSTFGWTLQKKKSDIVVALILSNSNVVEGMIGFTYKPESMAIYVDIAENNPKNRGV